MPRSSNKSQLILEYVNQFIQENGYAPSVREIGAAVGLNSTASVSYHIQQLRKKGLIEAPDRKGRKRALVTGSRLGQIPVIRGFTPGVPLLAVENQVGTLAWDGEPGCFGLRVRDDSMAGAGILKGDTVVIHPQETAQEGQIVLAHWEEDAALRRLHRHKGEIRLLPESGAYPSIDGAQARILGLVTGLIRHY